MIFEKMLAESIPRGTSFLTDLTNYWRMVNVEGFNMDTKVSSHLILLGKSVNFERVIIFYPHPPFFTYPLHRLDSK